jgi:hypothetical protein
MRKFFKSKTSGGVRSLFYAKLWDCHHPSEYGATPLAAIETTKVPSLGPLDWRDIFRHAGGSIDSTPTEAGARTAAATNSNHGSPPRIDPRILPPKVPKPRDTYVPDLHIDSIKVTTRDFR